MARRKDKKEQKKVMREDIPTGNSAEDIRARARIIGDFYAKWIACNPEKKLWNTSLRGYIHVKYSSINETKGHAALSLESTRAVLSLTAILKRAVVVNIKKPKTNDRNQKCFDKMVIMSYRKTQLLVGHQTNKNQYVQYCITQKK